MWKEIFIDEDLEDALELIRDVYCGTMEDLEYLTLSMMKQILETKPECHAEFYRDDIVEISTMYKYDEEYDRIVFFRYFFKFLGEHDLEHFWNVGAIGCKRVLKKHSKIIRITKYGDEMMGILYGITEKEFIERIIPIYAQHGIKIVEYENHIEYEWL